MRYLEIRTGTTQCEGEVAFFSAKRWDHRNRADVLEPATHCHDGQFVGSCRVSNPRRLTVLAAKSKDYTMAPLNGNNLLQNLFAIFEIFIDLKPSQEPMK